MKKNCIVLLVFLCAAMIARAQDPRFSQYYASPLTLNPATTGLFSGGARFGFNQRQQWWNVGYSYSTTNISADFKVAQDRLPEDDSFALGVNALFDKSLNGALQSNYLSVSGAYHKSLAFEGTHSVSLGAQINLANRHIDFNSLSFANQFVTDHFDTSIPADLNQAFVSNNYIDFNAGLIYTVRLGEQSLIYNGVSAYHLNRPNQSVIAGGDSRLPVRATVHGGGDLYLSNSSSLLYSYSLTRQAGFNDQLVGVAYGLKTTNAYDLVDEVRFYAGLWYAVGDAYIPYLGMDYQRFRVGLNYSNPVNQIYSYKPRTFEFSVSYILKGANNKNLRCPRF